MNPNGGRYAIDTGLSRFTARAFATGLLSAFGHDPTFAIRDYQGEASFSPDHPEEARLKISVQSRSLELLDQMKEKDRRELEQTMHGQVLESAKYPLIEFVSTRCSATKTGEGLYRVDLTGNLTMHGATQSQSVTAIITVGGGRMRAHGEFSVSQSAFGIRPVSVAGGTLKLKDEVRIMFDLAADEGG